MKKLFTILCLAAALLCGCSSKPGGVTEETYRTGKNALEAIDQYLDGEITAEEAHDKLDLYYDILDEHGDTISSDDREPSRNCSYIKSDCMSASYAIVVINSGRAGEMESLMDSRNDIAEIIGEPER